jgi:hypothetical protein
LIYGGFIIFAILLIYKALRRRGGESASLKLPRLAHLHVLDEPFGGDPRHHVVGMVHPLAALVSERERQSVGDLVR